VPPRLHHAALREHDDAIGELSGAQPVGHEEHRPPGGEPPEPGGDLLLLRRITEAKRRRGRGWRRGHERARERHPLALAAPTG